MAFVTIFAMLNSNEQKRAMEVSSIGTQIDSKINSSDIISPEIQKEIEVLVQN